MSTQPSLPSSDDEYLFISADGLKSLSEKKIDINGAKDIIWTTDYTHELPIRIKKKGPGMIFFSFLKKLKMFNYFKQQVLRFPRLCSIFSEEH